MAGFQFTITDAGRNALVAAGNTGTNAVQITQVGLTQTAFVAAHAMTALPGEFARLASFGGQAVAPDTIHLTVRDEGASAYELHGFGLYLADGTLFGLYGSADPIIGKSALAIMLLALDIVLSTPDAASIAFGPTGFTDPPASETVPGVVELATAAETLTGTDKARAVHPQGLAALLALFLPKSGGTVTGPLVVRARVEAQTDPSAAHGLRVRASASGPAIIQFTDAAAMVDWGHFQCSGPGALDFDGFTIWRADNFDPASKSNVGHHHVIAEVDGLQGALDGKSNVGHHHPIADIDGLQASLTGLQGGIDGKVAKTGDTMTGPLVVRARLEAQTDPSAAHGLRVRASGSGPAIIQFTDPAGSYEWGSLSCAAPGDLKLNGYTVWRADNFDPASKSNVGHHHAIAEVDGLQPALDGKVSKSGDTMTGPLTVQSAVDAQTVASSGAGVRVRASGSGPAIIQFTNPAGSQQWSSLSCAAPGDLKLNGYTVWRADNFDPASKSNVGHHHAIAEVDGLQGALDGKSNVGHHHAIAEVDGLQPALDGKVSKSGDVVGGALTVLSVVDAQTVAAVGAGLRVRAPAGGGPAILQFTDAGVTVQLASLTVDGSGELDISGNKAWHAGLVSLASGNPGYLRLPNGLILQWMRNWQAVADASGDCIIAVTFPLAFPSRVLGYSYTATDEANATRPSGLVALAPSLSGQSIYLKTGASYQVAVSGFVVGV